MISRRYFLRQFVILALAMLLDLFGFRREPEKSNLYKFNLGRSAMKIKPGETFSVKIRWPVTTSESPEMLEKIKLRVIPGGLYYNNLD